MSAAIIQERQRAPLCLDMPLAVPSAEAAMAFLNDYLPPGILSSGSGRRRQKDQVALPDGRRSDQGYIALYRQDSADLAPSITMLKSPTSILAYLRAQIGAAPAEHWVATQLTQYRSRRDGKVHEGSFSAETGRHILGVTVDLDGKRMASRCREMVTSDWWAFRAAVEDLLDQLSIEEYYLVRSGPEGAHLYLPLLRPDGRPLRATEANLGRWERVSRGLHRHFAELGADENAIRLVQPFAVPGIPRAKHPGFIPYVAARRRGSRADLFALTRRLSVLKLMPRASKPAVVPLPSPALRHDLGGLLEEISLQAGGVGAGERNRTAYRIGVYLLAKGASAAETWSALQRWNRRNDPALSDRELRRCLHSAERCPGRSATRWAEMQEAAWRGLRGLLGLPTGTVAGYRRDGRYCPITPAKSWEERKQNGGREHYEEVAERLLRFVAGEGRQVEMTQAEICNHIDTCPSTLKAVLKLVKQGGLLLVATRRGRGGMTILTLPDEVSLPPDVSTENSSCGNSSEAVEQGAWVGSDGSVPTPITPKSVDSAPESPVHLLQVVVLARLGLDLRALDSTEIGVSWSASAGWRVVGMTRAGQEILRLLERAGGLAEWRRRICAAGWDPGDRDGP